ncbi:Octanoyltransferase [Frankliniella fusca]|uniref:Octanoyltransferase n=1 Tax=Frankliniella fusca TaxID=407009 RepID=A0AAE1GUS8_9NEOP|nr:Octanoyltransferase [Frankliniella fusca]
MAHRGQHFIIDYDEKQSKQLLPKKMKRIIFDTSFDHHDSTLRRDSQGKDVKGEDVCSLQLGSARGRALAVAMSFSCTSIRPQV